MAEEQTADFGWKVLSLKDANGKERILRVAEYCLASATDLLDALSPLHGLFGQGHFFRGQGNAQWGLIPSAFRNSGRPQLQGENLQARTYSEQVSFEAKLLARFVESADRHGLQIPGGTHEVLSWANAFTHFEADLKWHIWPPPEVLRALSLAQHHGVPTRLLDWTTDPYTAAYFASYDAARASEVKEFSVWVAYGMTLSTPVPGMQIEFQQFPFSENDNLRAQSGLMMVYRTGAPKGEPFIPAPLEVALSFAQDSFNVAGSPLFYRLTLPANQAGTVLRFLNDLGVNGATAFPGYGGAARYAQEQMYWAEDEAVMSCHQEHQGRRKALYDRLELPWQGPIFHTGGAIAVNGVCTMPEGTAIDGER